MGYKLNAMDVDKTTPNHKDIEYDLEYEKDVRLWRELINPSYTSSLRKYITTISSKIINFFKKSNLERKLG